MKTRIIVNPMANKGNCGKRWPHILAEFERHLSPVSSADVAMTRAPGHATVLAQEAVSTGYQRLISVGGDGTFSEMMNGVISDDRPTAPDLVLAQLPGGTSNELCRSFGQLALGEACKAIAMGHTRNVDVFRADARGYGGEQVTRYGFVLAIVGAAATISWRAQRVPFLKRLGPISYVLMTAVTSLTYNPRPYRIRIDDEPEQKLPMWSLMLCSFDGAGEGLMLAPGADPADRKLDVILVGDLGHWETLTQIVPKLGDGSYLAHPKVSRRHASRISIDSDSMIRADVDGESIGRLPMSVTMLPFQIKVAAINRS